VGGLTRGERNIQWIEKHCRIPEGKFVGKPVELRDWQKKEIRRIYDNEAITRTAILSFARKNAKTALAAFLLLLHLVGPEAQTNSQLVSTALSRDQAAILFALAAKIVRMSPTLNPVIGIRDNAKQLYCSALGTLYKALSSDASTNFGASPVFAVHDELGQVIGPRSALYEAVETGAGAHDNPLSIIISTQAPTDGDLLSVLIDDALDGHDPRVVVSLYTAPMEDEPFAEETIRKANPAFGDFLNADEVMKSARDAERMPSRESSYRNLILNQRVDASSPFVSKTVWDSCNDEPAPLKGPIWGGLDLSARTDLTALVLVHLEDKVWHVHPYFWTPGEGVRERAKRDRVPYDVWVKEGWLRTTPGATVDYEYIAQEMTEIIGGEYVSAIAYDRWRIDLMKKELDRIGFNLPLIPHGQGYKDMSPALDSTESELLNGRLNHGGHPVLTMCAANAVVQADPAGNRKLAKDKSNGRIDGMVALAMAIAAATGEAVEEYAVGRLVAL
jgi:phage terminase large subunit-like protein